MLTYNSSLQSNPPASTAYPAMKSMESASPYGRFNKNHQDVLGMLTSSAAPALDLEAYKLNTDYTLAQQQAQRQLALAGLQQQSEAQQNQRNLGTQRLQMMTGVANDLLSGLYS